MGFTAKIPVYFVPGMGANRLIFENIKLPEELFEIYFIEWIIPQKNETIESYATRMTALIKHENPVLVGVSFGGIMVQEMARIIKTQNVIVVSSVKHEDEMPSRMKALRKIPLHKLVPSGLVVNIDFLAKYAFGDVIKDRMELYKKFFAVRHKYYMKWAINEVINWKKKEDVKLIHIHGNEDLVFPVKHIENAVIVKGGTHVMILHRYRWFNEHLPKLITEGI